MLNDIENKPNWLNWASKLRDLLSNLGFHGAWLNQRVGNKNIFLAKVRQRLTDNFNQNLNSRLTESNRANSYSIFLSNFNLQLFLKTVKVTGFRVALSKLRVSSHRLEIEVGRWTRPNRIPIEQRKCRICNMIEDEFHFLLECKSYNQIRKKYIKVL